MFLFMILVTVSPNRGAFRWLCACVKREFSGVLWAPKKSAPVFGEPKDSRKRLVAWLVSWGVSKTNTINKPKTLNNEQTK